MVSLEEMLGLEPRADDAAIGPVSDYVINDETWKVGFAVVQAGGILSGVHHLIPVAAFQFDGPGHALTTAHRLLELFAASPKSLIMKTGARHNESSQPKPASFAPEPRTPWFSFNAMLGCNISASDGVYGSLADMLVELEDWRIQYFVGRSYSWKKKSSVLIPTAWLEQVSWVDEILEVSASKEALEREPSYKPASHTRLN